MCFNVERLYLEIEMFPYSTVIFNSFLRVASTIGTRWKYFVFEWKISSLCIVINKGLVVN